MSLSSKFLGWDRPLVEIAAERLHACGRGRLPMDFSHLLVVVPTAEAARLLRERLAALCLDPAEKSGGAVNLRIVMPERLIDRPETASESQTFLAWFETLRAAADRKYGDLSCLFRNDVLARFKDSAEVLLGWGETLQQFRKRLAGEGFALADVAEKLNALNGEGEEHGRFTELLELEKRYLETLAAATNRPDPAVALLEAVAHPRLPATVEQVILIDCADLAGAPRKLLENSGAQIECWINAPAEHREHFDEFGCPEPGYWNSFRIGVDVDRQLRIVPRPDQQARKILDLLVAAAAKGNLPSAVGVLDPEVADALEVRAELAAGTAPDRNKVPKIFVPRELPLAELPWSQLLAAIVRLSWDATVTAAAEIWRSPFFDDYARSELRIDRRKALELLDELRGKNFVDDAELLDRLLKNRRDEIEKQLEGAEEDERPALLASLVGIGSLQKLAFLRVKWRTKLHDDAKDLPTAAFEILGEIGRACRCRHLDFSRSESELRALAQTVAELAELKVTHRRSELIALLLRRRLAAVTITPTGGDSADDVDAVGFLELPWRNVKTMLIAGFNEENFSGGDGDDIFLPDNAREALGMMTREKRRAADALRFAALAAGHDLYILCGRSSQSGETLFPARLLFQCAEAELPRRVGDLLKGRLVEEPPPTAGGMPPFLPWSIPKDEMRKRMSITGFSAYLKCPTNFYLETILGLRRQDPEPPELDPAAWGTFTHEVLQVCPRKRAELPPGETLASAMLDIFEDKRRRWFGDNPPGLVKLQCRMIRDSFEYFARTQDAEFDAGWEIVRTEFPVNVPWEKLFKAIFPDEPDEEWRRGITLSGKIDRIDFRENQGGPELRVLDYKTRKGGETPQKVHLAYPRKTPPFAAERSAPDEITRTGAIKTRYWSDLQLPLYVLLVKHVLRGADGIPRADRISAGYFNLPLELTETGIRTFDELNTPGMLESAARCADKLLYLIFEKQVFWPSVADGFTVFRDADIAMTKFLNPFSDRSGS